MGGSDHASGLNKFNGDTKKPNAEGSRSHHRLPHQRHRETRSYLPPIHNHTRSHSLDPQQQEVQYSQECDANFSYDIPLVPPPLITLDRSHASDRYDRRFSPAVKKLLHHDRESSASDFYFLRSPEPSFDINQLDSNTRVNTLLDVADCQNNKMISYAQTEKPYSDYHSSYASSSNSAADAMNHQNVHHDAYPVEVSWQTHINSSYSGLNESYERAVPRGGDASARDTYSDRMKDRDKTDLNYIPPILPSYRQGSPRRHSHTLDGMQRGGSIDTRGSLESILWDPGPIPRKPSEPNVTLRAEDRNYSAVRKSPMKTKRRSVHDQLFSGIENFDTSPSLRGRGLGIGVSPERTGSAPSAYIPASSLAGLSNNGPDASSMSTIAHQEANLGGSTHSPGLGPGPMVHTWNYKYTASNTLPHIFTPELTQAFQEGPAEYMPLHQTRTRDDISTHSAPPASPALPPQSQFPFSHPSIAEPLQSTSSSFNPASSSRYSSYSIGTMEEPDWHIPPYVPYSQVARQHEEAQFRRIQPEPYRPSLERLETASVVPHFDDMSTQENAGNRRWQPKRAGSQHPPSYPSSSSSHSAASSNRGNGRSISGNSMQNAYRSQIKHESDPESPRRSAPHTGLGQSGYVEEAFFMDPDDPFDNHAMNVPGGNYSEEAMNAKWTPESVNELMNLLEPAERYKWKYVSDVLSQRQEKRIPLRACKSKFNAMFGETESSSLLRSSLFYVAFKSGWESIRNITTELETEKARSVEDPSSERNSGTGAYDVNVHHDMDLSDIDGDPSPSPAEEDRLTAVVPSETSTKDEMDEQHNAEMGSEEVDRDK